MISESTPISKERKFSFSIVIPCLNEKDYIKNCINSILQQSYEQNLIEIIIVDGFSEDGTREIIANLQSSHAHIKLYDNPHKKTPQALNIGIKKAINEVIVILGAHTELDKDFIKNNNTMHVEKNVMISGGTQTNLGKSSIQNLIGLVMQIPFGMGSAKYRWSNKEQFVDTVVYAAYRKELFDNIGYFEENYTISEDAEFNWRIRQAGYKILYSPNIKSFYYPRDSVVTFIKQIFRYGILRVNVIKKHFDSLKLSHLIAPAFVLAIFVLIVLVLISVIPFNWFLYFISFYFLINLLFTFPKINSSEIKFYFWAPILIFLMHLCWGLGFLIGLFLPKSKDW